MQPIKIGKYSIQQFPTCIYVIQFIDTTEIDAFLQELVDYITPKKIEEINLLINDKKLSLIAHHEIRPIHAIKNDILGLKEKAAIKEEKKTEPIIEIKKETHDTIISVEDKKIEEAAPLIIEETKPEEPTNKVAEKKPKKRVKKEKKLETAVEEKATKLVEDSSEIPVKTNAEYDLSDPNIIEEFENYNLAELGNHNNTQIFTRREEIDTMIDSIGRDYILNYETTILEPTSGDGAFTTRILEYRLEKYSDTKKYQEYLLNSLRSLSTIYSIEYQNDTCYTQKCNLYTAMLKSYRAYVKKNKGEVLSLKDEWLKIAKDIIFENVMWGEYATSLDKRRQAYLNNGNVLGFDRKSNRALIPIKWTIDFSKSHFSVNKSIIGSYMEEPYNPELENLRKENELLKKKLDKIRKDLE